MAPNLAIKSDSWLDLTARATGPIGQELKQEATSKTSCNFYYPSHRHSIGGPVMPETSSSNGHMGRRHPQWCHSNHSISTTLSSNLSNSIELSWSLATRNPSDLCQDRQQRAPPPSSPGVLLRRESVGLKSFRDRLERRAAPARRRTRGSAATKSPLARSWSSLSEHLGDKLNHFGRSCKQFLYNHTRHLGHDGKTYSGGKLEDEQRPESVGNAGVSVESLTSVRRRLTVDWVKENSWQTHGGEHGDER